MNNASSDMLHLWESSTFVWVIAVAPAVLRQHDEFDLGCGYRPVYTGGNRVPLW